MVVTHREKSTENLRFLPTGSTPGGNIPTIQVNLMKPNESESAPTSTTCQVVLCTCPNESAAKSLARALVSRELAACVNILPAIRSVYRWENEVLEEGEALLLIKTRQICFQALESAIRELHPYDVPEIIALDIAGGSRAYTDWLVSCVSPGAAPELPGA